jgi:ADP-heptose:LPS heptosyltransferase
MEPIGRHISLLLRKWDSVKDRRRVLRRFAQWQAPQHQFPPPRPQTKRLLIIRLDDIGDYLLFRNQLAMYKESPRWRDHEITLLGNDAWQDLFTLLDEEAVDDTLWVKKNWYLENAAYRLKIWRQLREKGFETVIAASNTRPLLLDDLCMLAAAPRQSIGNTNSNVHDAWNQVSDPLYTTLFDSPRSLTHEFHFNAEFALWACGIRHPGTRPEIERQWVVPVPGPYLICFVGASTRSKRWPVERWIEFINLHRRHSSWRIFIAGNSKAEIDMARIIQEQTGAQSIAGGATLTEILHWICGAQAVVTNDSMAAHMGASFNTPTVIIANGVNYLRFSDYRKAGIDRVATLYPDAVNRRRKRRGDGPYAYSETVTADIASIQAESALDELNSLLEHSNATPPPAVAADPESQRPAEQMTR